jgi:hypothetical protein
MVHANSFVMVETRISDEICGKTTTFGSMWAVPAFCRLPHKSLQRASIFPEWSEYLEHRWLCGMT